MSLFQHSKIPIGGQAGGVPQSTVQVVKIERPNRLNKIDQLYETGPKHLLTSAEELQLLHKESKDALAALEAKIDQLEQVTIHDVLVAKRGELASLIKGIEDFASQSGISLTPQPAPPATSKLAAWKQALSSIKTASKEALNAQGAQSDANPKIVSNDLEITQKDQILRKLMTLYDKLRRVDEVVGDLNVFQGKSVSQVLEEEMEGLQCLDKLDIQRNTRKIEYVTGDLAKNQPENKSHLTKPEDKKEVLAFLGHFFADFSEADMDNISKLIYEAVDNFELRTEFLNRTTKVSEVITGYRKMLIEAVRVSEENQEALRNLRAQTKKNVEVLKANSKRLKK